MITTERSILLIPSLHRYLISVPFPGGARGGFLPSFGQDFEDENDRYAVPTVGRIFRGLSARSPARRASPPTGNTHSKKWPADTQRRSRLRTGYPGILDQTILQVTGSSLISQIFGLTEMISMNLTISSVPFCWLARFSWPASNCVSKRTFCRDSVLGKFARKAG